MKVYASDDEVLVMRQFIGNGEYKGVKFELSTSIPQSLPIVEFDDGTTVCFELEDIIPEAFKAAQEGALCEEVTTE